MNLKIFIYSLFFSLIYAKNESKINRFKRGDCERAKNNEKAITGLSKSIDAIGNSKDFFTGTAQKFLAGAKFLGPAAALVADFFPFPGHVLFV